MRLKWFRVREFQSVRDSGRIDIGDITCLVGKNESGKTALLRALYRLNPLLPDEGRFDVTLDYPRMYVEDYRHDVESGRRKPATPVAACYALDNERNGIAEVFGPDCLKDDAYQMEKTYENKMYFQLNIDETAALKHLVRPQTYQNPCDPLCRSRPTM